MIQVSVRTASVRVGMASAVMLLVSGCGLSAGSIDPVAVNSAKHEAMNCDELTAELTRVSAILEEESDRYENWAAAAIPVVLLVGDFAVRDPTEMIERVGRLKGERLAITSTMRSKKCDGVGEPAEVTASEFAGHEEGIDGMADAERAGIAAEQDNTYTPNFQQRSE